MFTLKAPAKINWFLYILGLRNDGFHEIQSLIQKISLYDILKFSESKDLILKTNTDIPLKQNLVYKAAKLLKKEYKIKEGVSIHLKKNIPIGAGLGGGSSDAAATLTGLNKLWSLNLSTKQLSEVAEQIGSDVPFFLNGSLSFVHGRGEKLIRKRAQRVMDVLLVKPPFTVSTAWAYKSFSEDQNTKIPIPSSEDPKLTKKQEKINNIEHFIRIIERAEVRNIATGVASNDLEFVTIKKFPIIAEIKEKLLEQGAVFSLMSGSGPTVFGVFDSHSMAEKASRVFDGLWTAVTRTLIDD
jgi:4-diphosphocytidyl-2-C-methyl-D-erythritol kinase